MEITKDFIKFIAEIIVTLLIFSVVFGEGGIASNTYNYLSYAEHIMMQDYISTAFTVGSKAPGNFITSIKTSGQPFTVEVFNEEGVYYVSVQPKGAVYLRTKYADIEPVPIVTDCAVEETKLDIPESIRSTLIVRKIIEDGVCTLSIINSGAQAGSDSQSGITPTSSTNLGNYICFSGYFSSLSELQRSLSVFPSEINMFRISFNPSWYNSQPHPFHPEYVDYLLDNTDYTVIVDRNHHLPDDPEPDWQDVEDGVFEVLQQWPNNPRVIVEIINEYSGSNFYTETQKIITAVRDAGYTNKLLVNRLTTDQHWTKFNDPLGKTYQGQHFYFNMYSVSEAESNLQEALDMGITKMINTEIGADYNEWNYFDPSEVQEVNQFLDWSSDNDIVNCVWMREDDENLAKYQELGLSISAGEGALSESDISSSYVSNSEPPPQPPSTSSEETEQDSDASGSQYTFTAASGSAADVQAAVNNVQSHGGGIVKIPSGTYNWVEAGQSWKTVVIPSGVSVIGGSVSGSDSYGLGIPTSWSTVLIDATTSGNGGVWFELRGDNPRLSNIKLVGYRNSHTTSSKMVIGVELDGASDFRIDHNSFLDLGRGIAMYSGGNMYTHGVIDHNMLYNEHGHDNLANYLDSTVLYGIELHRDYRAPFEPKESTLGHYTDYTIYIENNYFSKWRHVASSNHGAFYVFRYNVVNEDWGHMCMDIHGKRDSDPTFAAGQGFEVYENRFLNVQDDGSVYVYWQIASGYGVWFNNYIDDSGWNPWSYQYIYKEDPNGYPSTTWHVKDFYFWSKQGPYQPSWNGIPSTFGGDASRNVYADWNRQAGNPSDSNYPNVDPSWSIAGYKPYTYPHPLTG